MIDFQVAYDKLASLQSADEIADLFLGYGVKGLPRRPTKCAVSIWIEGQTGVPVITSPFKIYSEEIYLPVTDVISEFISNFDDGMYPDLRAEEEEDFLPYD